MDDIRPADGGAAYDVDFFAWTQAQAAALRAAAAGGNAPLDYENLAEEIESLGQSDRRELTSRLSTIIEHLVKLLLSPAQGPRPGWRATVERERRAVEDILEISPSLRREVGDIVRIKGVRAVERTLRELRERGELTGTPPEVAQATERCLDPARVTGEWLPD